jgi:hypothetical protein
VGGQRGHGGRIFGGRGGVGGGDSLGELEGRTFGEGALEAVGGYDRFALELSLLVVGWEGKRRKRRAGRRGEWWSLGLVLGLVGDADTGVSEGIVWGADDSCAEAESGGEVEGTGELGL